MARRLVRSANLDYYSFDRVMSYNAVYNFIVGARGLGKTYGWKKYVIRLAIRTFQRDGVPEQFIYLRRFKTEIKGFTTFFADIHHEFPEWDFRVEGNRAQMAPKKSQDDKKRTWTTIGYGIALSNAQSQKSVAYPMVTNIGYDEFIIEKGALHYLPNEAKAFNDFFSTVDRWKDKTRVWFLANALAITNPFFLEYDILPDKETPDEFMVKADGFICVHFPDSASFTAGVKATRFGRFISDTDYANYAISSEFADNHDRLIDTKPSSAIYQYTIETSHGTFSVWFVWEERKVFVQERRPKREIVYTTVQNLMQEDKTFLPRNDKHLQYLRARFNKGTCFFDGPRARNAFIQIFGS